MAVVDSSYSLQSIIWYESLDIGLRLMSAMDKLKEETNSSNRKEEQGTANMRAKLSSLATREKSWYSLD